MSELNSHEDAARAGENVDRGPRSMRIAITSLYLPGSSKIGVGFQVHGFANALVDRGHVVTVFSPDRPGEDARYEYHHVDSGSRWRTFRFALRLRSIDFSRFDMLHAHGDDYFLFGRRRPPHLRTMYGSCLVEARHIRGVRERVRMLALGIAEIGSTMVADKTVAISKATTRVYPWIDQVIPCGVDVSRFAAGPHESTAKELVPTVLFVGTYRNRKRGRLLCEVFMRDVLPSFPDAQLWMVCSDAPGGPHIEVLGRLNDDELIDRYRRAWVFCLPSSYEGFGVPYIEAMAAGCPVVATPNPGAREVLGEGEYGILAEPQDLGHALRTLLGDHEMRETMATRGSRRAHEFGWTSVIERYEGLYMSLAEGARR